MKSSILSFSSEVAVRKNIEEITYVCHLSGYNLVSVNERHSSPPNFTLNLFFYFSGSLVWMSILLSIVTNSRMKEILIVNKHRSEISK